MAKRDRNANAEVKVSRRLNRSVIVVLGVGIALAVAAFFANGRGPALFLRTADNTIASAASAEPLPHIPSLPPKRSGSVAEKYRRQDAVMDDWETEVLSEVLSAQLMKLGEVILDPTKIDNERLSAIALPDALCDPLRPANLALAFRNGGLSVYRADTSLRTTKQTVVLSDALTELRAPLVGASDARVKFKIVHIDLSSEAVHTTAYYHASARFGGRRVQQNATFRCSWFRPSTPGAPLLERIAVSAYEEIVGEGPKARLFADCTEAVLGHNRSFREQLVFPYEHWLARIDIPQGIQLFAHHGVAIGDVNGDGLDDVFICQPAGLPNILLRHNADGTATDISRAAGVDYFDQSHSALILDLDNDGDQDLIVATSKGLLLMSNDGSARFSLAGTVTGLAPSSMTAADYDSDGDLDLYVCGYDSPADNTGGVPIPYHDANNGSANSLLRNDGHWRFTDVTSDVGLDVNNRRFTLAAAWEDYDNDGDMDLYVANDFGRNNLYRNDGGTFVDVSAEAGVEDMSAGMSVTWGDYDNDGLMDLYVSNMFSSAGNRVAYQRRFKSDADEVTRSQFQRHARGNSLFKNLGDGTFRDVSAEAGVLMGRWAWGSKFVDINNDGLEDLVVTNGLFTNEDSGDL